MSDQIKKIDREFCWTDESVNVYGYRCLTNGLMLDEVKKNPIGFKMHNRDNGVVVRWEDFRIDGAAVYAKPVINLAHPDSERTISEIENGFLNGASAGKIVCLAASDDPKLLLPGQTAPTVTKWYPREISLVDIPGNFSALAKLYDENDNELNLADFVKPKNENMSKLLIAATVLTALNLKDDVGQEDFNKAIMDLADNAAKVPQLTQDLADMTIKHNTVKTDLETLQNSTVASKVSDLLDGAVKAKKITVEAKKTLAVDYATNPDGLKNLLDALPAQQLITEDLKDKTPESEFTGKKWDDLYTSGQLEIVRVQYPDLYTKLKNEKYPNLKD